MPEHAGQDDGAAAQPALQRAEGPDERDDEQHLPGRRYEEGAHGERERQVLAQVDEVRAAPEHDLLRDAVRRDLERDRRQDDHDAVADGDVAAQDVPGHDRAGVTHPAVRP